MVNILRKLILVDVFLMILSIYIVSNFETSTIESSETFTGLDFFYITFGVIYLINFFFLYKLKPMSRYLFLFLIILDFPLSLLDQGTSLHFDGSFLGDNLALLLSFISYMITGMILSLLFFTDLKKEFK